MKKKKEEGLTLTFGKLQEAVDKEMRQIPELRKAISMVDCSKTYAILDEITTGAKVSAESEIVGIGSLYITFYITNRGVKRLFAIYTTRGRDIDAAIRMGEFSSSFLWIAQKHINAYHIEKEATDCPEERLTAGTLRELMGDRNIPELRDLITGKQNNTVLDLLDRNDYFASKLWCEEDIKDVLKEEGYPVTEANIMAVMNDDALNDLADCADYEWNIIYDSVVRNAKK